PLERKTHEGVRVEPLIDPPVILTSYAVTRRGRTSWPPLRLVLDQLMTYR
ncbi:MAG: LysR family transcriptional regulator, partial [Rhodococcus sp. (in: high G+C Gram-positive bacteria)]